MKIGTVIKLVSLAVILISFIILFVHGSPKYKAERLQTDKGSLDWEGWQLVAGNPYDTWGEGNLDGTGVIARFREPRGLAVDDSGIVYVADTRNHSIRKITPDGTVTTLAGKSGAPGFADGQGQTARFNEPLGIATDRSGNAYVVDRYNLSVRKITPEGMVSTVAMVTGDTTKEGVRVDRLSWPMGIAVDRKGQIFVSDTRDHVIRRISQEGIASIHAGRGGGPGYRDGSADVAQFSSPAGLAIDRSGNLYVADHGNDMVRKITPGGTVTTIADKGNSTSHAGTRMHAVSIKNPTWITVDSSGNVFVTSEWSSKIYKVGKDGIVSIFGGVSAPGRPVKASLPGVAMMRGIAIDRTDDIVVIDGFAIRRISPTGKMQVVAGRPYERRYEFWPGHIAIGDSGELYFTDWLNHSVIRQSRQFRGALRRIAGTPDGKRGHADGKRATFNAPSGLCVVGSDTVYVADQGNHAIRMLSAGPNGDAQSWNTTTVVGPSANGDGQAISGPTGLLALPGGVVADGAGNVYVADTGNSVIRRIGRGGEVTTIAGMLGESGSSDGIRDKARFYAPEALAVDAHGWIFVADTRNHVIRKISPSGEVTTIAGKAGAAGSLDGKQALFHSPSGLTVDKNGEIYVADTGNHTIRKITPDGVVTTVVGAAGEEGFVPGKLPGRISSPKGIAIYGRSLYVATGRVIVRITLQ